MIAEGVGQKQQCLDDLFINADVQVQSTLMGWRVINKCVNTGASKQLNPESKMLALNNHIT